MSAEHKQIQKNFSGQVKSPFEIWSHFPKEKAEVRLIWLFLEVVNTADEITKCKMRCGKSSSRAKAHPD
jgi:hypothetical protein